jgi:Rieske Fe-S protein
MMAEQHRRSFLTWATHGLGVLFAAILGAPAVAYVVDGLNRKGQGSGFRPVDLDFETFKKQPATPQQPYVRQGVIRSVRRDAWTLHPNDVIGRVWVVKHGPGENDFRVFTTICPHLGCSINVNPDNKAFTCPCHGARFNCPDGTLAEGENPAPRGMDELQWKVEADRPNVLLVEYKNFRQAIHDKIEK